MGHLITFAVVFHSRPDLIRKNQELYTYAKSIQSKETPPTDEEKAALKRQNDALVEEITKIFEPIKRHIIDLARAKGYTGNGYITEYGETNAWEWVADLFAHTLCNTNPNLLGQAMEDWLKAEDAKLAVSK